MIHFTIRLRACWCFFKLWALCRLGEAHRVKFSLATLFTSWKAHWKHHKKSIWFQFFLGEQLPRTTFSWRSSVFLWAYFIYGLLTTIVVYTFQARVSIFISSSKRFDEVIYSVIFISLLLPHFLLPIASWRNGAEVAIFKNMWTNYQLQFYRVTGTPIIFDRLAAMSWIGCVRLTLFPILFQTELWLTGSRN